MTVRDGIILQTADQSSGSFDIFSGGGLLLLALIPWLLTVLIGGITTTTPAPAVPTLPTACPVCTTTVCSTPAPCSPVPTCPPDFIKLTANGVEVPDKCYFFTTSTQSFALSQVECARRGGLLVNPATNEEGQAVKEYLQANDPGTPYYAGYTDLGTSNQVIGISGGPVPIPVFGLRAASNTVDDCWRFEVSTTGAITIRTTCQVANKAICEVDLSRQSAICP